MRLGLTRTRFTAEDMLSFNLDKIRIDEVYRNKTEHLPSIINNRF